jgi:hypothetical protein
MNKTGRSFLRIAGVCSILAPVVLLIGDAMLLAGTLKFEQTIVSWLSFVLFVPAILGMTYLAASGGHGLALVGGASAFFGTMAGASMQVFFRVRAVLNELGLPQTVDLLRASTKLVASTQMIGIFFPIGLVLLALGLYRSRTVNAIVPLSLAIGALLFPMGRIAGLVVGFVGGDLLLLLAFAAVGRRLLSTGQENLA